MKRSVIFLLTLIVTFSVATAQTEINSIFEFLRNSKFHKAKELGDQLIAEEKYTDDAILWFYTGNAYLQLFLANNMYLSLEVGMTADDVEKNLGQPEDYKNTKVDKQKAVKWLYRTYDLTVIMLNNKVYSFNKPRDGIYLDLITRNDALVRAKELYIKAIQIDQTVMKRSLAPMSPFYGLDIAMNGFVNLGVISLQDGKVKESHEMFMESVIISMMIRKPNEYGTYWAAYTAMIDSNYQVSDKLFQSLVDSKSSDPKVYADYSRSINGRGDMEKALEIVKSGYEIIPDNDQIAYSEADIYLKNKDFVKTKDVLERLLLNDPDNAKLSYFIGDMYNEFTKDTSLSEVEFIEYFNGAKKFYEKAIELDSTYFNAVFNFGILYHNYAVDLITNAPQGIDDESLRIYREMKAKADSLFRLSVPLLEKAREIDPKDLSTVISLRQIYIRLDMLTEAKEMKEILETLKAE